MTAAHLGVLRGRRRFAEVSAWRASGRAGAIRVSAAPTTLVTVRVGFAISGIRHAVDRNRLRRRLRVLCGRVLAPQSGLDVIVHAGAPAAALGFGALGDDLSLAVSAAVDRVRGRMTPPVATAP